MIWTQGPPRHYTYLKVIRDPSGHRVEYKDSLSHSVPSCEAWAKQILVNVGLEGFVDEVTASNKVFQRDNWSCGLWVLRWIEQDLRARRGERPMPAPAVLGIRNRVNAFIAKIIEKAASPLDSEKPKPKEPEKPKSKKPEKPEGPKFDTLDEALEAAHKCTKCLPTKMGTKGCAVCMGEWFEKVRMKGFPKKMLKKCIEGVTEVAKEPKEPEQPAKP